MELLNVFHNALISLEKHLIYCVDLNVIILSIYLFTPADTGLVENVLGLISTMNMRTSYFLMKLTMK